MNNTRVTGNWLKVRENRRGLLRQRLLSSLLRSIRSQLSLDGQTLADYLGVSLVTIRRWERGKDGVFPRNQRWKRIRDLWALTKLLKDPKFWLDRVEPPDFMN